MLGLQLFVLLSSACFVGCFGCNGNAEEKFRRVEEVCIRKDSVEGFHLCFFGYTWERLDTIGLEIRRNGGTVERLVEMVPLRVVDSIRDRREHWIEPQMALTDTLVVVLTNELRREIYDFQYRIVPQYTMFSSGWGCRMFFRTDEKEDWEYGSVSFFREGWDFVDPAQFRDYYRAGNAIH